ncbi:MAG TPA: hypothetical protein VGN96_12070 [Roseococcus sp.]|jgi:hypothetical protein|nr:hypothetical protein [Roseococcus sp.]
MAQFRIPSLFGAAILGAGLLAGGAAFAQPGPGGGPRGDHGARMFQQLDTNNDSRVTWEEAWGVATQRFQSADADRSGGLSQEEFANMYPQRQGRGQANGPRAERMQQHRAAMFRGLDANRDGVVTLEEMRAPAEMRFRMADANGDGAITRDELPQRRARGEGRGPGQPGAPAAPATR